MADILRLERIDFDNLENRDAICKKVVGVFVAEEKGLTAYGKADEWFRTQPPVAMYLGWDGQVYPQFRLIKEKAL